jgi:hypothetical protein
MSRVGFIISLDNVWDNGNRTNWCNSLNPISKGNFWTNQSIQLSGTSVDNATARVGDNVTIQVEVRGLFWTNSEGQVGTVENQVTNIQAWACYPNTIPNNPGLFNANSIVSSMNPMNPSRSTPPTLPNPTHFSSGASDDPPPASTGFLNLTPVWQPTSEDVVPPNHQDGHICIVATCAGIADVNGDAVPIGTLIANDDLTKIDICNNAQQGQRNIAVLPVHLGMFPRGSLTEQFGFLSGVADPGRQARVVLDIVPLHQLGVVDPAVLSVLQSGPYRHLTFKPAQSPPKGVSLQKNPHQCHGWLAKIICEAEEIVEDVIEDVERLLGLSGIGVGKGTRLRLTLPPNGLQPLVFNAELDPSETPGNVHVFDIIQTDQATGERGGYRIAVVAVP